MELGLQLINDAMVEDRAGGQEDDRVEHLVDVCTQLVDAKQHGAASRLGNGAKRMVSSGRRDKLDGS